MIVIWLVLVLSATLRSCRSLGMWWPGFTQQTTIFMKYARAIEYGRRETEREAEKFLCNFASAYAWLNVDVFERIWLWMFNKRDESSSSWRIENRIQHAEEWNLIDFTAHKSCIENPFELINGFSTHKLYRIRMEISKRDIRNMIPNETHEKRMQPN